jgi:transcriptional regulator with XRE-family HTH domain
LECNDFHAGKASFGGQLRMHRMKQGLSLAKMSKLVYYSKGHLSRVETGEKSASEALAVRCDEALRVEGELISAFLESGLVHRSRKNVQSPMRLPSVAPHFTGRRQQLSSLDRSARQRGEACPGTARIMLIDGAPGVGKTTLALHWAHQHAAEFTDGVLFQDLHGSGPHGDPLRPRDALADCLRSLGVASASVPDTVEDRAAMYHTLLSRRRMLIVLDNAATADQVRSLMPGAPGCMVLVTSRNRLGGLVARDGASRLSLQPFCSEEAAALLRGACAQELRGERPDALLHVARLCDHLPLAIRVAAEHYSTGRYSSLDEMAAMMESNRLDFLSCPHDPIASVRAVFSWSYHALEEEVAHAFRLICARAENGVSTRAAARILGTPDDVAAQRLDALYQANLLVTAGPGRYRCASLLADYATELSTTLTGSLPSACGTTDETSWARTVGRA